ncbi:MAG: methionyl-tRNA formyltransferase [Chitinophagales bacterium]|nr:methionyl-tRNA formyltransferase [Chitinophagales bacterium]
MSGKTRIVFLGCTKFSEELLATLFDIPQVEVSAIFSIPKTFSISYSKEPVVNTNYADLQTIAEQRGIPFFEVDSVPGKKLTDYTSQLQELAPDVMLVLGWYYMVPKSVRNIAKAGAWGIHASLLPKYAGGAPLVWAIINGETQTGVTLFKLDNGVDDGDIICQQAFPIEKEDTIKEVYAKATEHSKLLLKQALTNINNVTFTPQDKSKIEVYPQRKPEDGEIDWNWDPERIKNFVRAQTKPYPGAYTIINNKKIILWDIDIANNTLQIPTQKN